MMKFAKIMELADMGNLARIFPGAAEVEVYLYDGKDRIYESDDVQFVEPLFAHNSNSYERFFNFIDRLDSDPPLLSMNVKIDVDYVTVFYKTPDAISFRRNEPLTPLD